MSSDGVYTISASLSGDEISDVPYLPLDSHPELYIPYKLVTVFQAICKKYYSLQIMVLCEGTHSEHYPNIQVLY